MIKKERERKRERDIEKNRERDQKGTDFITQVHIEKKPLKVNSFEKMKGLVFYIIDIFWCAVDIIDQSLTAFNSLSLLTICSNTYHLSVKTETSRVLLPNRILFRVELKLRKVCCSLALLRVRFHLRLCSVLNVFCLKRL